MAHAPHGRPVPRGVRVIVLVALLLQSGVGVAPQASAGTAGHCGALDVTLVLDTTASMGTALSALQSRWALVASQLGYASGGDYQLALVTFHDNVTVRTNLAPGDAGTVGTVLGRLRAWGGNGTADASDEALATALDRLPAAGRPQRGDFDGVWRDHALRLAIVITDAPPGGFDDTYTPGVDDVHGHQLALDARERGTRIDAVFVNTTGDQAGQREILQGYAATTGGLFRETTSGGGNLGDVVGGILASCGTPVLASADALAARGAAQPTDDPQPVGEGPLLRASSTGGVHPARASAARAELAAGIGSLAAVDDRSDAHVTSFDAAAPTAWSNGSATGGAVDLPGVLHVESFVARSSSRLDGGVATSTGEGSVVRGLSIAGSPPVDVTWPDERTFALPDGLGTVTVLARNHGGDGHAASSLEVAALRVDVRRFGTTTEVHLGDAWSSVSAPVQNAGPRPTNRSLPTDAPPAAAGTLATVQGTPIPGVVNDDLTTATPIITNPWSENETTQLATERPTEPRPCHVYGTVWFRFTAAQNGSATASTAGSDFYTAVAVYQGPAAVTSPDDFAALQELACDAATAKLSGAHVTVPVTAGTTYYVQVGGVYGDTGLLRFRYEATGANGVPIPTPSGLDPTAPGSPIYDPTPADHVALQRDGFAVAHDRSTTSRPGHGNESGSWTVTTPAGVLRFHQTLDAREAPTGGSRTGTVGAEVLGHHASLTAWARPGAVGASVRDGDVPWLG